MAKSNPDVDVQKYQAYLQHRMYLIKERGDSEQSLDKALLTLSSGALAFSLTFVQEAFDPVAFPHFLALAWGCFGISVVLTLGSFLISRNSFERAIQILDDQFEHDSWDCEHSNWWSSATTVLNVGSITMFVLALVLLLFFAIANVV